jgi:hypothetical protein
VGQYQLAKKADLKKNLEEGCVERDGVFIGGKKFRYLKIVHA